MAKPLKILIIGNGFGGIYTLKNLHKHFCGNPDVEISIVGTTNYFLFTPLLHEVATGSINPENIVEPIQKVLGCCVGKFHLGRARSINLEERIVEVAAEKISYDYLVLAPGAETNFYDIRGAEEFALPLKSLEDARIIKNRCVTVLEYSALLENRSERKKALSFTVVGGGPTGVELVAELYEFLIETFSHYYPREVIEDISVAIIQKDAELLPQFAKKLRGQSRKVLEKKGIKVLLNTEVREVKQNEIILNNGSLDSGTTLWVAGTKPALITWQGAVLESRGGKLAVNEYMQLKDFKNVFALGDYAYLEDKNTGEPVPALAQAAVQEAEAVAKNIKFSMQGRKLEAFKYRSSGALVSVGQWMAVGEIFGFYFSGRFTWWLWRTVYLFKLISMSKKIKVAIGWTINLFSPRDISQL